MDDRRNGVRERFPNLTRAGVGHCRSMPRQEPVQIAEPFTEFWAKGNGASENRNRSLPPFLNKRNQAKNNPPTACSSVTKKPDQKAMGWQWNSLVAQKNCVD